MQVGIVDYGGGNLRSLARAVESLGHSVQFITKADQFSEITHLLFPGQGAYGDCLAKLTKLQLIEPIQEWITADKPFFGICVGYQLLFEESEEATGAKGLGVINGKIQKFTIENLKVPHMGWNSLQISNPDHPFWAELESDPYFYFVHSYRPESVEGGYTAATCQYGGEFIAAIAKGNLVGTQFHPEKSQHNGLRLIQNFLRF